MSVSVPQPFVSTVNVAQPFRSKVEGIPDTFSYGVTALPQINIAVEQLPVLRLSVDNLPPVRFTVDPIEIRLTEIPSVRTHLPADFAVNFSILGIDLGSIRLCGEAQIITEPYRPNPCETCGPALNRVADVTPVTPADTTTPYKPG
jgi:hypothetical protein